MRIELLSVAEARVAQLLGAESEQPGEDLPFAHLSDFVFRGEHNKASIKSGH